MLWSQIPNVATPSYASRIPQNDFGSHFGLCITRRVQTLTICGLWFQNALEVSGSRIHSRPVFWNQKPEIESMGTLSITPEELDAPRSPPGLQPWVMKRFSTGSIAFALWPDAGPYRPLPGPPKLPETMDSILPILSIWDIGPFFWAHLEVQVLLIT